MRYELKSLGPWAFIKVSFFLNLVIGFILGVLYAGLMGLVMAVASTSPFGEFGPMPFDGEAIGGVVLLAIPFIFAIGGAIFHTFLGLIVVGAYNLIARMVGGLEMTLEPVDIAQPVQTQPAPPTYQIPPPPPAPQQGTAPVPPPPPATEQPPAAKPPPSSDSNPETP
jgi:hypothetical protein